MLSGLTGLIAEVFDDRPQGCVIDAADQGIVLPEFIVEQGLPVARDLGQIGNDYMDMRLRVELAARVVLEQGIGQMLGTDGIAFGIVDIGPSLGECLLDPAHGLTNCLHMGSEQALVAGDIGQDAGGLWHGEGQVDASSAPVGIAHLLTIGQAAFEQILEGPFLHLTGKTEFGGAVSTPATDLAGVLANVIVILGKIVGSAARRTHRSNRQHGSETHIHVIAKIGRCLMILSGRTVAMLLGRIGEGLASPLFDGDLLLATLGGWLEIGLCQ